MRHLLSDENGGLISQIAWARVLVAFDFDGTLAPIVDDRDSARMRPATSRLFGRVADLYPCAVISGRSRSDVATRLDGATVKYIVGNHGLEPGAYLEECESEIDSIRTVLTERLSARPGVDVEDKRYSLAIHYRRSRRRRDDRASILDAIAALPARFRVVPGKSVINVIPARAPNKGTALLELREAALADTALYVGDDVTDEDVFSIDQPGRLLSVRVGESAQSAAPYFLREQGEIDELLAALISAREGRTGASSAW